MEASKPLLHAIKSHYYLSIRVISVIFGFGLAFAAVAAPLNPPYARSPHIDQEPNFNHKDHPSGNEYTEYKLKEEHVRAHAIDEVRAVTGAGSFIARSLRVITGNGGSKIFETITGEDGLTFGIKDFTSDGLLSLLHLIEKNHPGVVKRAFGENTKVLEDGWLAAHKSKINDHGLIDIAEVRRGLNVILCDPEFHSEQLERYKAESVDRVLDIFKNRGYEREFTLAAMIGAANSGGSGGLKEWLAEAEERVGTKDEKRVIPEFMRIYALRDAKPNQVSATDDLIAKVFHGKTGSLPDRNKLGHSGRRLRWLAEYFSWSKADRFTELGAFGPQ
jgi:hypothetical protein